MLLLKAERELCRTEVGLSGITRVSCAKGSLGWTQVTLVACWLKPAWPLSSCPRKSAFSSPGTLFQSLSRVWKALVESKCVLEPWVEGCLPTQMMAASFFGRNNMPFCVVWVTGAQAGIWGGAVEENCSSFGSKAHFERSRWNHHSSRI